MKQLVIFPKGALSAKDKERMSKEGYLAIESDDPSKVVMPVPSGGITGDEMTLCALNAMNIKGVRDTESIRARFADNLTEALNAKRFAS